MRPLKPWLALCAIALLSTFSIAQSTEIVYKQKGKSNYKLTIQLADEHGLAIQSPDQFIASDKVYFTLSPNDQSERAYFKESDLKNDLLSIVLYQKNEQKRVQAIQPIQSDGKIVRILLTYLKSDLQLWKPMTFRKESIMSGEMVFPENYFDDFEWFNNKYQSLRTLEKNEKYDEMLKMELEVLQQAEKSTTFNYMQFYTTLTEDLPFETASAPIRKMMEEYEKVESKLILNWEVADFKRLNEIEVALTKWMDKAKPYSTFKYKKSKELDQLFQNTNEKLSLRQSFNKDRFVAKKVGIIEQGKYDQFQFQLFVDLLYQTILKNGGFKSVNKNISLDYPLKKEEESKLDVDAGWKQQYNDLLYALHIQQLSDSSGLLFNKNILRNLYNEIVYQPKPYFEIFSAANSAVTGTDLFVDLIEESIKKSNSMEDISKMEIMKICYPLSEEMSESFVSNLNNGMKKLNEGKWKDADFSFELGIRQNSQFAPAWYFLGYCKYKQGEVFSAQSRIDQALLLYPEYVTPKLFLFSLLEEQSDYIKILQKSKEALATHDVFLFHLWKAKSHFLLKQYNEAIDEIKNGCLRLNPNNEDAYYLLGDVYVALKKIDLAREAYLTTQQINPFESALFNEKMSAIAQIK